MTKLSFEQGTDFTSVQDRIAKEPGTTILRTFDTNIFSGVSVESTGHNLDSLGTLDSVAQAWSSRIIQLDTSTPSRTWAAAEVATNATSGNYSVHAQTGVDKLHARGIYGDGAVIAIVDTGTQYTHPALGGCLGAGCKIAGGYDLIGDGCWPEAGCDVDPDDDPFDQQGHGTHVAGIAVGRSSDGRFVGVAPEATVLSYKVFTDIGSTTEDVLIEAFLMAYEAGADIITCSVGGGGGWPSDAWAVVASRIAHQGVIVTIAAGNDGQEGPFVASDGSSGHGVLAVASVEAEIVAEAAFLANITLENHTSSAAVGYYQGFQPVPYTYTGLPIYAVSLNTSSADDACQPLDVDLTGKIALVRVGNCDGTVQQAHVQDAGAHLTLWYLADDPYAIPNYKVVGGFTATISQASGEALVKAIAGGGSVVADFSTLSDDYFVGMINSAGTGGLPNYYTSWGPLYDLAIKPDISAPGGDILSTYPSDTYAVLSGTSMATPYIAGVAALYIGHFGGRRTNPSFSASELTMRILASGQSLAYFDGTSLTNYGMYAPVAQVGTGMVNASNVLSFTTSLSYAKFALNDTRHFNASHAVDITNGAGELVAYTYGVQAAAGVETYNAGEFVDFFGLSPMVMNSRVALPGSITLGAGETATVE